VSGKRKKAPAAFHEAVRIVAKRYGLRDPEDLDLNAISIEEARILTFAMEMGRLPTGTLIPTCTDGKENCVRPSHMLELGGGQETAP
jgi:hypothetical protein